MTGVVYIIGPTHGPFKIGRSKSAEVRLRPYRTHSPLKLSFRFKTGLLPNAAAVEAFARYRLRDYDLDYDWFDAPLTLMRTTVLEAVDAVAAGRKTPRNGYSGRGRLLPRHRLEHNAPVILPVAEAMEAITSVLNPGEDEASFVRAALEKAIAQRRTRNDPS